MKKRKIVAINHFLSFYTKLFGNLKDVNSLGAKQDFKSIVIYSSTALGDLMFNTPAIHALKKRYPDAIFTLVSSDKNRHLVMDSTYFDKVIYWDNKVKDIFSLVARLRKMKPELTVILHSYIPYDVLSAVLSGSQYIIRDNYSCDSNLMNHWMYCHQGCYDGHLIQRKLDLLTVIGCDNHDTHMHIPVRFDTLPTVTNKTLIGFQMGASEEVRCWPREQFVALARKLFSLGDHYHIVLIGSAKEKELERQFLAVLSPEEQKRVTSYIAKTTLPQLLGIIQQMDVLVTGDTGPLHLAVALQTRTISLFYTANPRHTGPYQDPELHRIIYINPDDNKALLNARFPLEIIEVDRVYNLLREILP
ncbi:ADP-heptose:LPS heptosyltransferase [Serratia fonticola]|jgi:ADP-heptose:LPS heptosyltransferase|uniref:ADP-heptose:LPS heptosyltransferase n=1 Tax=Serratia fonticola TaxID=47917 RepID=A0A559T4M8_SERFO|nr:glycosyltransferase family 9 protein [Serratia fonticola]TQI77937.1 ADP-heptose:LPS heptosyltransferase [Serratia fonticola]TQI95066.1 ADP-heptose:LPS heptosyltransferase [Serratia fonticola]TVZ69564.1 ADP-heptose:LPS heptosyltransferase [Serratia fonticola]